MSELIAIGAVVAMFGLSWRMYSYHDTKTSRQLGELAQAIAGLKAEVAALGAKVDILVADRRPGAAP